MLTKIEKIIMYYSRIVNKTEIIRSAVLTVQSSKKWFLFARDSKKKSDNNAQKYHLKDDNCFLKNICKIKASFHILKLPRYYQRISM